jgi:hypothetical protein
MAYLGVELRGMKRTDRRGVVPDAIGSLAHCSDCVHVSNITDPLHGNQPRA